MVNLRYYGVVYKHLVGNDVSTYMITEITLYRFYNLNGLQMWFDAIDIDGNNNDSLTNGSNVTIWNDRILFSIFRCYTSLRKINHTIKITIMGNGMPTVRFDKSTDDS